MTPVYPSHLLAQLAAVAALLIPASAVAQDGRLPSLNGRRVALSADSVLLLDTYGRTVYAKNADDERPPASVVKLMTLYLAGEDIQRGKADLEEPVQVSHYASLTPKYRRGLRPRTWIALHVLLEGGAIASPNAAAAAPAAAPPPAPA